MEIHNKVTALPTFFFLLLISFFSLNANAVSPPSASGNQSDGNYTITYNHNTNHPVLASWLEEKVDGGAWTTITDSAPLGTINFTDKVNGTYQYRVVQLEASYYSYPLPFTIIWSPAITVVVTGGAPSDMAYSTQLTYNYQARRGDINADGLQDLYIKRTSGGSSNNGVLYETILTQLADKTFSVLSASTSQKATASGWPTINVDIRSADFNIDGYIDLVVKDIGNHISGAANQMIFSSGNPSNGQASAATSLGSYINKTMTNIAGNFSNPDYFDQYMVQVQVPYPILVCGYYYDYFYESLVYGCWYEYVIVTVPGYDPNFVSQEGLNFAFTWTELEQASTDGDFRTKAEILYDIFGTILGIDMGVDRPDFNNQNAVEEALAKIWVILSDLCGEAGVAECISSGSQTVGEEVLHGITGLQNCTDQLLTGQAPLPFTGNPFKTPKVAHSGSQNFAITSSQLSYSSGTNDSARRNFWLSRFNDSKDPMGPMGVNVVDNAYILGCIANERTLLFAFDYGQTVSLTSIGVDMMVEHRISVGLDNENLIGKLSAGQVRDYHSVVFNRSGLPSRTFGGAPLTGSRAEAEKTKFIWCPSCDD